VSTCNQLDLETLGFWPIMSKNIVSTTDGEEEGVWKGFIIDGAHMNIMLITKVNYIIMLLVKCHIDPYNHVDYWA
jgi:hypothetical protein